MKHFLFFCILVCCLSVNAQKRIYADFYPGKLWFDTEGNIINAHGGGILYHEGTYYWFGEHKDEFSNAALVGVTCYSSKDLYNWKFERIALPVSDDPSSPIVRGSIIERPKVIYNKKTDTFVMYFHLELKGEGYNATHVGMAISKQAEGPYTLVRSSRVNAGKWPDNLKEEQKKEHPDDVQMLKKGWTPEWLKAVADGLFVRHHFKEGQMSRDMTLYVDDDDKAYHIYASEDNATIQIAELTDDYQNYTGKYIRIFPATHNEAPTIFKKDGTYWLITSGCTGWKPNEARMFSAPSIWGPWTQHPNPCQGKNAELTFHTQGTYILPVHGQKERFVFMADRWCPENPIDGRYVWLPILFEHGVPVLRWADKWNLTTYQTTYDKKN
ncbi:glycoside hydrolase family 43 protein [Bacteroides sp.]|uniref:glycoside hydrolase family 43 protein n=1 Tax=Bacteroides sp. TaxID=29523 RepID=UPI003A9462F0